MFVCLLTVSSVQMEWTCVPNITEVKMRKRSPSKHRRMSKMTVAGGEKELHSETHGNVHEESDRHTNTLNVSMTSDGTETLTCPVVLKAVEEMQNHHDQSVKRDECNVHLKGTTRVRYQQTNKQTMDEFLSFYQRTHTHTHL